MTSWYSFTGWTGKETSKHFSSKQKAVGSKSRCWGLWPMEAHHGIVPTQAMACLTGPAMYCCWFNEILWKKPEVRGYHHMGGIEGGLQWRGKSLVKQWNNQVRRSSSGGRHSPHYHNKNTGTDNKRVEVVISPRTIAGGGHNVCVVILPWDWKRASWKK